MEKFEVEKVVTEEMLAVNVGSGSLRVLATPVVAALMEEASTCLADTFLESGMTTVGTMLNINHIAPTPLGATVKAVATLKSHNARAYEFEVVAYDNQGEIANGTHSRVAVYSEKFQAKADSKIG